MSKKFLLFLVLALFVFAIPSYASAQRAGEKNTAGAKAKKTHPKKADRDAKPGKDELDFASTVMRLRDAYRKNQLASALVHCEQAMDLIPASVMNDEKDSVIALYLACFDLYGRNEQHEKALKLAEMIRMMTDDDEVRKSLCFSEATTLTKLHRWQDAREKYAECPGNGDAQMGAIVKSNVAELYMIEGDCASAAKAYRESLDMAGDNPHALYGLAVALSRLEEWDEARKVFLSGVGIDPNFKFLEDAFFVPDCENDYQDAFRMYELGRLKEAKFYLERYIQAEERTAYRQQAQRFLERVAGEAGRVEGTWPVLLHNVTALAVDSTGKNFAFASLERDDGDEFKTSLYVLDGAADKAVRRAQLPKQKVYSAVYMPNGGIRFLGPLMRYELLPEKTAGYYLYHNDESCFPLSLVTDGSEFLCVRDDGMLSHSPWLDPYRHKNLLVIPNDSKRVVANSRFSSIAVQTPVVVLGAELKGEKRAEDEELHLMLSPAFTPNAMAAHPTKNLYAMGIRSGTVIVKEDGTVVAIFGSPQPVDRVAFDPSGKHLAVLSAQTVEVWRVPELDGE